MNKIDFVSKLVYKFLCEDEKARDDDIYLYFKVCKHFNASALEKPFGQVLSSMNELGIPPFETVRRSRQRNQALYPGLSPSEEVKKKRDKAKKKYREYARGEAV